jgi:chromosome segregation ATPase
VKLEQLKERVRQLDEAMRQDQQRIFDTYNQHRDQTDSSNNLSMQVGSIQMQMAKRGQEKKALVEQIAKLSAELGMAGTAEK